MRASSIAGANWVGFIMSGQFCGQLLGAVIFGGVADRIGPKKTIVLVLFANAFIFAATAVTESVALLVGLRFFGGFFNAMGAGQK